MPSKSKKSSLKLSRDSKLQDPTFCKRSKSANLANEDSFLSFTNKLRNSFVQVNQEKSLATAPRTFKYRLLQHRSGVGLLTHFKCSAMQLAFNARSYEIEEKSVILLFVLKGKCEITYERTEKFRNNGFVILDGDKECVIRTDDTIELAFFLVPLDYLITHSGLSSPELFGHQFCDNNAVVELLSHHFREAIKVIPIVNTEEAENITDSIFVLLRSIFSSYSEYQISHTSTDEWCYEKAMHIFSYAGVTYSNLTLKELAERVGVSSRQLSATFARRGTTAMKQLKQIRLRRAATMLRENHMANKSIAEIAAKNGFKTQQHFCREFKNHFGKSPSEYRSRYVLNRATF